MSDLVERLRAPEPRSRTLTFRDYDDGHTEGPFDPMKLEAADELEAKDAIIAELVERVEKSNIALNDWLHQYAGEFCNEAEVEAAAKRVGAVGTIGYIAETTKLNRDALSKAKA